MTDHRCCGETSNTTQNGIIRKEVVRETRVETVREITVYSDMGTEPVTPLGLDHCLASTSVSDSQWGSACWKWDPLQNLWAMVGTYHLKPGARCFSPNNNGSAGNMHAIVDCIGPA